MTRPDDKRGILVVAEHDGGRIKPVSLEAAAFARKLSEVIGGKVTGVVLAHKSQELASDFSRRGGLPVPAYEHNAFNAYNARAYVSALKKIISRRHPAYVVIPHTAVGWDYAPGLAAMISGPCLSGVSAIGAGDPPGFIREICGGKIALEQTPAPDAVAVITVMPGAWKAAEMDAAPEVITAGESDDSDGAVTDLDLDLMGTANLGRYEAEKRELDLSKAQVIVAAGRGVGAPEKLGVIKELAACFDRGAVGASRPVVDAGWLPYDHQVGQTGQTVAPRLYIACGVSGALQHVAGMKNSETIVAVNIDPAANIFSVAHLGVAADLHEFLPVLIEKIRK